MFGMKITFTSISCKNVTGNITLYLFILLCLLCLSAACLPDVTKLLPASSRLVPLLPSIMVLLSGSEGCCSLVLLD